MKISVFGEIIWDIFETEKCIGGAPLNFGAHASLFGNEVVLYSAVGHDDLGKEAIEYVEKFRICTDYIEKTPYPTGQCLVTLDKDKIPSYNLLENVAYDFISLPDTVYKSDIFYFGTLAIRSEKSRDTLKKVISKGQFVDVFCDVNIRPPFYSEETVKLCFSHSTILKISREELPKILPFVLPDCATCDFKTLAEEICETYPNIRTVIITLDKDGAFAFERHTDTAVLLPASPGELVSTVGAGDGFSAAFVNRYAKGVSLLESVDFANRFASYVVSHVEAIPNHSKFEA